MNFSLRPSRRLAFANLLGESSLISNVEFQKISMLDKKSLILVTAKETSYVNFDWRENTINLLINKKRLSLIKVFRNFTLDPTRILTTPDNDKIIYFKRDTATIEIACTNENYSLKSINTHLNLADVVLCPVYKDNLLLISGNKMYRYNYVLEQAMLVYTADSELENITIDKKLKIIALASKSRIHLICIQKSIPLATVLLPKPLAETPQINEVAGKTVLSLFCKEFPSESNGVSFRCYDIKRPLKDLLWTDLKRLESDLYLDPSRAVVLNKLGYMMLWNTNSSKEEAKSWLEFRNLNRYGEKELPVYSILQAENGDETQESMWSSFEDDNFLLEVRRNGEMNVFKLVVS